MSFTYVKATMLSPNYLEDFYTRHPNIQDKDYATQHAAIMLDSHVWADHISRNLGQFGVKSHELVYNAGYLNQAWAREYGSKAIGNELFIEQLRFFAPDVIFLHTYFPFYAELVPLIRKRIPEVRLIQGYIGVGFTKEHYDLFRKLDFVTTCEHSIFEKLTRIGACAYHIDHGFEHTLVDRIQPIGPQYDVLFTGSILMSNGYHIKRSKLLEYLIKRGIDVTILSKPLETRSNIPHILRDHIRPPVYGMQMLQSLARAKIGINVHIDAISNATNIRLFEATGAGTCLLTEDMPGLNRLFEPDREVATYKSFEECADKINWLLENEQQRSTIAKAGQERTLSAHRLEMRVKQLYEIILKELDRVSIGRKTGGTGRCS